MFTQIIEEKFVFSYIYLHNTFFHLIFLFLSVNYHRLSQDQDCFTISLNRTILKKKNINTHKITEKAQITHKSIQVLATYLLAVFA